MAVNYCTNPEFETDTTGYFTSGIATLSRPSGDPNASNQYCLSIDAGAGLWGAAGIFPIPRLGTYTISFDVWLAAGASDWVIGISGRDSGGTFVENLLVGSAFTAGSKVRISRTVTPRNASTTQLQFGPQRATAVTGEIRIDRVRIAPGTDGTWAGDATLRRIRTQFQLRPY